MPSIENVVHKMSPMLMNIGKLLIQFQVQKTRQFLKKTAIQVNHFALHILTYLDKQCHVDNYRTWHYQTSRRLVQALCKQCMCNQSRGAKTDHLRDFVPIWRSIRWCNFFPSRKIEIRRIAFFLNNFIPQIENTGNF